MEKAEKQILEELFQKLKAVYDDKDFVMGVLLNAQDTTDRQTIIDFIDKGEYVTPSSIIALSVLLDDAREKPRHIN